MIKTNFLQFPISLYQEGYHFSILLVVSFRFFFSVFQIFQSNCFSSEDENLGLFNHHYYTYWYLFPHHPSGTAISQILLDI